MANISEVEPEHEKLPKITFPLYAKVIYFSEMICSCYFFFLLGVKMLFFNTHLLVFLINRYF